MSYMAALRLFNRNVRLYLLVGALIGFAFLGIFTLLINLYLLRLGYGIEFIGIFGAAGLLTIAVFALPAGMIGARLGNRRAMISALALIAIGLGLLLFGEFLPGAIRSACLVGTYVLTWMGGALFLVIGPPFVMANTSPAERNHAFAVNNALFLLTSVAGSLAGGILPGLLSALLRVPLADPAPYRIPMWIAWLAYPVALFAFLRTDDSEQTQTETKTANGHGTPAAHFPYGMVAVMMAIMVFRMIGETAANGFFNVYLDTALRTPTSILGLIMALARLLAVPAALAAPLLIQWLGLGRTSAFLVVVLSASMLPLALIPHVAAAGLGLVGVVTAGQVSYTTLTLFHQQVVQPEWRTAMSGGVNMASGLSQGIVSLAGGFAIAAWGFRNFFLSAAALTLISVVLFVAYFRNSQTVARPAEAEAVGATAVEAMPEPEALAIQ